MPFLNRLGGSVVYEQQENGVSYYALTFLGVLLSSDGRLFEDMLIRYLQIARDLALRQPERTHVLSEEVRPHLSLFPDDLMNLGRFLNIAPFRSSCSIYDTGWKVGLPEDIEDLPDDLKSYIVKRAVEQYDPQMPVFLKERWAYISSRPTNANQKMSFALDGEHVSDNFVDKLRMNQLNAITSKEYDLTRLLELCNELNVCYANECYLAVAMLTRALLDHVPPIFGFNTFSEVANNYTSQRSFKESMLHLDISCRNIADTHLHVLIRNKEVLPSKIQVNFANDVDVLLAEIIRILR